MSQYKNDLRMIAVKFSSSCYKCKTKLLHGSKIFYWPSKREVFSTKYGEGPYRQYFSSALIRMSIMDAAILTHAD